jgi:hypothetical protein
VSPCFVVPYNSVLDITSRAARSGLFTVALAFWFLFSSLVAELFCHSAETVIVLARAMQVPCTYNLPETGAAHIQWAFLARRIGVSATLCLGVAVRPTDLIRTLTICPAILFAIVAITSCFRTTGTVLTRLRLRARVVILSPCLKCSRRQSDSLSSRTNRCIFIAR